MKALDEWPHYQAVADQYAAGIREMVAAFGVDLEDRVQHNVAWLVVSSIMVAGNQPDPNVGAACRIGALLGWAQMLDPEA